MSNIKRNEEKDQTDSDNEESTVYGPVLPKNLQVNNSKNEEFPRTNSDEICDNTYGPSLPPKYMKKTSDNAQSNQLDSKATVSKVYGPSIPSASAKQTMSSDQNNQFEAENENAENSDEDEVIGPLPTDLPITSKTQYELELRALQLKTKSNDSSQEKKEREAWMLELPDVSAPKTLGPRQFRSNPGPDLSDRSSWTNTPEHKKDKKSLDKIKSDLKLETELLDLEQREKEQDKIVNKLKKKSKRDQSLLEIHRENLNKKKKNSESTERRPFDRDIDLQLHTLNPLKKKQFIDSTSVLNSKFASGKTKYL